MDEEKKKSMRKKTKQIVKNARRVIGEFRDLEKEMRYHERKFKSLFG